MASPFSSWNSARPTDTEQISIFPAFARGMWAVLGSPSVSGGVLGTLAALAGTTGAVTTGWRQNQGNNDDSWLISNGYMNNASGQAVTFARDDTTKASLACTKEISGPYFRWLYTAAAAGAITWTEVMRLTSGGALVLPAAGTLGPSTTQQHTLPAVASDTIALLAATQALSNKTITASTVSGLTVSTTTGTFTLTNAKTLAVQNSLTLAGTDGTTMTFPTISSTLFADAAHSFAASGYQKFGNGLIFQWGGTVSIAGNGSTAVTFPIAFPTAIWQVVIGSNKAAAGQVASLSAAGFSLTGFTAYNQNGTNADNGSWWAVGN